MVTSPPSKPAGYGVAWLTDNKFQSLSGKDRSGSAQRSDCCAKVSKDWLYGTVEEMLSNGGVRDENA